MSLRVRERARRPAVTVLGSAVVLVAALVALSAVTAPPPLRAEPIDPLQCPSAPDGTLCVGVDDDLTDCLVSVCLDGACKDGQPSPVDMTCKDTDGNLCTTARCVPKQGICDQAAPADPFDVCGDDGNVCTRPVCEPAVGACGLVAQEEGKPCGTGEIPDFCPAATCSEGICVSDGESHDSPEPDRVADVLVTARPERVTESEAFNDCCFSCRHQSLEALRPTELGPRRTELDGGLPLRRKLCGTILDDGRGYGVNDESADPRDMLINIIPGPGFEHFTAGLVQNACNKMTSADKEKFQVPDAQCPLSLCATAADFARTDPARQPRCVHAEIAPPEQFYRQDRLFLPIDDEGPCSQSPSQNCSSRLEDPSVGIGDVCVYGVFAFDHGEDHRASEHTNLCCIPGGLFHDDGHEYVEIHPFDAVWWRHPSRDGWVFAVFQDDSNRFSSPHCGDENNKNRWSQAPRDVTFRFPFSIPRAEAPVKACIRYAETENFAGASHQVRPLNVSTPWVSAPLTEGKLMDDGTGLLLEVVEPAGVESQTQVRIDGCALDTELAGFITLRVAVGCTAAMGCTGLQDRGDPGSGFYYGELVFAKDCAEL